MDELLKHLFSISRTQSILSRNLSPAGLDFKDYMILFYLDKAEGKQLRRIDLAERLGFSASGITRIILPLEKQGIIERAEDEEDARARYARLTRAGERVLEEANFTLEIKLEKLLEEISRADLNKSADILELISEAFLEDEYRKEAKERWSDSEAYKQSVAKMKKMSREEIKKLKADGEALTRKISESMSKGSNSKESQDLIAEHFQSMQKFYDCSLEMYQQLGEMYVEDPRFRAYYDKFKPGLARFMRGAIRQYCRNNSR